MSQPKVYLETSFFRYLIATPSTDARKADRQRITRDWWQDSPINYDLAWQPPFTWSFAISLWGKSAWRNMPFRGASLRTPNYFPWQGS